MTTVNRRSVRFVLTGFILACLCVPSAHAVTITWTGDLSDVWTDASFNGVSWDTNWDNDGGGLPNLPTPLDTVVFTGVTPNNTISLTGNVGVNDIQFGGSDGYTLGAVLSPHTITLISGNIDANGSNNTLTINAGVDIGVTGTWDIGDTVTVAMNGEISGGQLVKTGLGTMTNGSNNSHLGTRIEEGVFAITAVNQLGTTGVINALTTLAGGELRFDGPLNAGTSRPIALDSTGNINTNGQNVEWSSVLSGTGGFTKTGTGMLTLDAANTYTGTTTISRGTLRIGKGGTAGQILGDVVNNSSLIFNRSDNLTYSGDISGNGDLTIDGAGTLTLEGNYTYTGTTTINDGTLQIGNGGTSGAITGDIVNNSSLIFNRSDNLTYSGDIVGSGDLTKDGDGTLTLGRSASGIGSVDVRRGTLLVTDSVLSLGGLTVGTAGNTAEFQVQGGLYIDTGGVSVTIGPDGAVSVSAFGLFDPRADLNIDGGSFTMDSTGNFVLDNSRTLTATNDAQVDFAGNYAIVSGTHFDLQSGSDLVVGDYFDMMKGTLTVDGAGTTVNTNTTGSTVNEWGYNASNTVTVRNSATYTINNNANLFLGDSGPGSATLNIESDADFNANALTVATTPSGTATINLSGTGSTLTQSGASTLTVGSPDPLATGTGTINVTDNATFDTGTGVIDFEATGVLNVNTGGLFDATPPDVASAVAGTPGVTVTTTGVWTIADGEVRLNGGRGGGATISTNGGAGGIGGVLNMNAGSLELTGTAQLSLTGGRGGNKVPMFPTSAGVGGEGGQANLAGGALTLSGTSVMNLNGGVTGTSPSNSGLPRSGRGGTMNVSGAAVVINAGATASLNGGQGASSGVGNLHAGNGGHGGELNLTGGSVDINGGTLSLFGGDGRSSSNFSVDGGDGGDGGTLTVSSGVLTVNSGLVSTAGGSRGMGGPSGSDGADGAPGLINLTGGTFTMNGGEVFTGTFNHPGTGAFNFLGGTLTVDAFNGDLTQDGGTLAPGTSPGTTAITGNYVMNAGTLAVELGGLTPGSGHDQITVTGDVTIAGDLDIALTNGFTPSPGMTMELVTFGGNLTGAFNFVINSTGLAGLNLIVTSDADSIDLSFDALAGDLNLDGFVGIVDLNIVLGAWNQNVTTGLWDQGDPSGDGFVGIDDLNTVLGNWNAGTPPTSRVNIPEPVSGTLLLALVVTVHGRRLGRHI